MSPTSVPRQAWSKVAMAARIATGALASSIARINVWTAFVVARCNAATEASSTCRRASLYALRNSGSSASQRWSVRSEMPA